MAERVTSISPPDAAPPAIVAAVPDPHQPYSYPLAAPFEEPDWRRLPGFRDVTEAEWLDAAWQRRNAAKSVADLQKAFGDAFPTTLAESIVRDQREHATMSMLIPPQMLNTMEDADLWSDPIRRYMAPAWDDRDHEWPSHPMASRDSLHEADMWPVEGLTHRYPTKVLAELVSTCPQYCGHCTRMDLVGNSVPQVAKYRFQDGAKHRHQAILDYIAEHPGIRDVVVSGGDMANVTIPVLEKFVGGLIDIPHVRDIRLATKGLAGLPQHFLKDDVLAGLERLAAKAVERDVDLAVHTHVNHAQTLTPLVARVVKKLLEMGFRDVRNQGVLLRGVNTTPEALLDLSFTLLDRAKITPYYFYMCDMIPSSEHWRVSLAEAQGLQHAIMGYLPGFATPRIVCDVPYVGKRWVHQAESYDRLRGVSYWTKNYRTRLETDDPDALRKTYEYYDPIPTLPEEGRSYWRERAAQRTA